MDDFLPVRGRHALEEVSFTVTFREQVSFEGDVSKALLGELEKIPWKQGISPLKSLLMSGMSSGSFIPTEKPSGFIIESAHQGKIAAPTWKLVVTEERCVIFCGNYDSWAETKGVALAALTAVLAVLETHIPLHVAEVHAQFKDVFICNGIPQGTDFEKILRRDSRFISKLVFEQGPLWHVFQGWLEIKGAQEFFKSVVGENFIEVIQNINLAGTKNDQKGGFLISATHLIRLLVDASPQYHVEQKSLDSYLNYAHDTNVQVVKEIFTDAILQRIGLGDA